MKKIHKLLPCSHWDVERIESWLTDMAAEGLHMVKEPVFCGFFAFEKGLPGNVRYRLEPKQTLIDNEKPDADTKELCEEYGWEFVTDYGLFYIYRSLTPDAREMNTDPQVQAMAMKGAFKQLILPSLVILMSLRNSLHRLNEPIQILVSFGIVYTAGYYLVMLSVAVLTAIRLAHLLQLRRKLTHDIPMDHNKPWRKQAFFSRFGKVFGWSFYIFILIVMLTRCSQNFTESVQIGQYEDDPPFVTVSDLCPEGEYQLHNGEVYNTVDMGETYLAPLYMEWHEEADVTTPDGKIISGSLDVIYYELKTPWLAEELAKEFYRKAQKTHGFTPWEDPAPAMDVDYIIAYTVQNAGYPTVIMQKDHIVIQGRINISDETGYNYLAEWATQMAEIMK